MMSVPFLPFLLWDMYTSALTLSLIHVHINPGRSGPVRLPAIINVKPRALDIEGSVAAHSFDDIGVFPSPSLRQARPSGSVPLGVSQAPFYPKAVVVQSPSSTRHLTLVRIFSLVRVRIQFAHCNWNISSAIQLGAYQGRILSVPFVALLSRPSQPTGAENRLNDSIQSRPPAASVPYVIDFRASILIVCGLQYGRAQRGWMGSNE